MRLTEADRDWKVKTDDLKFKYLVGRGFYLMFKGFHFHFNPMLILKIVRSKQEIVLGSSWNDFNVLCIAFLKSLKLINNKLSVWSEANYLTSNSQKKNKLRDWLRSWFFSQIDGSFIMPGKMSEISFEKWNIPIKNTFILPNLVSSPLFERAKPYHSDDVGKPILFIVARLDENLKGIKNFLSSIGKDNLRKVIIKIAGTGASEEDYVNYINLNGLQENVLLLGNLSQMEISEEYKKSHLFVLPSYSDPSPLAIVEAISAGLPVLISERCGNHFETVFNGENGYTFDPFNQKDIREKFETILLEREKWNRFSKRSIEISKANFNSDVVLRNLVSHFEKVSVNMKNTIHNSNHPKF